LVANSVASPKRSFGTSEIASVLKHQAEQTWRFGRAIFLSSLERSLRPLAIASSCKQRPDAERRLCMPAVRCALPSFQGATFIATLHE
jgi:hypothetical protein